MKIDSISNYLRGIAITGVVVENSISFFRISSSSAEVLLAIRYIQFFGASLVHIFFFLSGYGLARKYHDSEQFNWKIYAINRFSMIVVPYWILVTGTYLFVNILHVIHPAMFETSYGLSDLFSYVLFVRNHNRSAWGMNPTLWFMGVIFGLYIAFPFLLNLLNKQGVKKLLLVSALIAYSSRCIYWALGYEPNRESSVFLFYLFEFSVGMALARIQGTKDISLRIGSTNALYFLLAALGYGISFLLKIAIGIGANLHEVFTYVGSVALGIFSYQAVGYLRLGRVEETFRSIGAAAFIIYLTHAPPIQHVIRPILGKYSAGSQGIVFVSTLLAAYFILLVLVSQRLAKYFKTLSIRIEGNLGRISG